MKDFLNIVPEFLSESLESLSSVEKNLVKILNEADQGKITTLQKDNKLLRVVHSINGGSSFLGLDEIEKVSGWFEKILMFLKTEKIEPGESSASLVKEIFDLIKDAFLNKGKIKKRPLKKIEKQVTELFDKMNGKAKKSSVEISIDGKDFSFSVNLNEIRKKLEKRKLFILNIDPVSDLDEKTSGFMDFINNLSEYGDILDSVIDIENVYEESVPVSVLFLSDLSGKDLRKAFKDLPENGIVEINKEFSDRIFGLNSIDGSKAMERKSVRINDVEGYKDVPQDVNEEQGQETETEDEREFVSFRIGNEFYAVSIKDVFDMKEMLPCSRIPNQPEHMLGVMNLRGNVVPVVDLRLLMGRKDVVYNEFSVFLIVKVNDKITGCVVDAIDDVVFLEAENTQITPATSRQINIDYVKFIAKDPKTGRFLIVLDLKKMLANE